MKIPLDKFENYLRNKNLKDRTIENYLYYFNKFHEEVFNQETTSRFLAVSSNRNSIARGFLLNLKKFLTANYVELGLSEEVRANIISVEFPSLTGRKKKRIVRAIPHEKIELLEKCLETEREKLQLLISYYCALRLGELLKIMIVSIDWDKWKKDTSQAGEMIVLGKGDKEGKAYIPSFIMPRVARYIHSNNFSSANSYLFRDQHKEYNFKALARSWQLKLSAAAIRSGVSQLDDKGKVISETSVHPHRLRHSYGSYLINEKKMDVRKVQILLRHSDISSTQIYTHVEEDNLKKDLSDTFE